VEAHSLGGISVRFAAEGNENRDGSFPADAVRSDREPNGDFVRFVGFSG
jgi:hypothetical protein